MSSNIFHKVLRTGSLLTALTFTLWNSRSDKEESKKDEATKPSNKKVLTQEDIQKFEHELDLVKVGGPSFSFQGLGG